MTHSAEQSARNFIDGKTTKPKPTSLALSSVIVNGAPRLALCSYGPHFPVIVDLGDGRFALNTTEYGGDAYRDMIIERRLSYATPYQLRNRDFERHIPKHSPTTHNHISSARSALQGAGYTPTGETIDVAGYTLGIYRNG